MNITTWRPFLTGVAAVVALSAAGFVARGQENAKPNRPLVQFTGTDSKILTRSEFLVTSQDDWRKLWIRHTGKPSFISEWEVPQVNFDKCMVVALFQGPRYALGVLADSATELADRLVLRIDYKPYSIGSGGIKKGPDHPFGFVVLPRTDKPVVIEEAFYSSKDAAPVYKERARLQ